MLGRKAAALSIFKKVFSLEFCKVKHKLLHTSTIL
jgi:hypothetical protein